MEAVSKLLVAEVWSAQEVVCHSLKAEEILPHDLGEESQMCCNHSLQEAASAVIVCALREDRSSQVVGEQVYCRTVGCAKFAELESGVVDPESAASVVVGLGQLRALVTSCLLSVMILISDIP